MFATLTIPTGSSAQFLLEKRFSSTGTSRSHRSMSFTARTPSRVTIQAVAGTSSRVKTRKPANLYEVLRVKETASPIEIKAAYRSLAKQYHPDAAATAAAESDGSDFIKIHNAYATLCDPMARAQYDLSIGVGIQLRYAAGNRPGFTGQTRRWETDQCW